MSTTPIIDGLEYPLCNAGFTDSPCVGVIGGFQDEQECKTGDQGCQNLKYGASSTIMGKLARLDKDPQCGSTIAKGAVNLPLTDVSGFCHPCDDLEGQCVNQGKVSSTNLVVNDAVLGGTIDAQKFDLQTLHKIWGNPTNNQGVSSQNVYISPTQVLVKCAGNLDTYFGVSSQNVIVCEAHGSDYGEHVHETIKGVKQGAKVPGIPSKDAYGNVIDMPGTKPYLPTADGRFVGGVVTTRKAYGPGVYNVLAYTPSISKEELGYVFAIWPFHYSEVYNSTPPSSQQRGDYVKDANADFPCFGQCDNDDDKKTASPQCPTCTGLDATDYYDVINHEIDIEIPANVNASGNPGQPPPPPNTPASNRGVDTMNFNTWVNDINDYSMGTGAYYQNLGVRAPNGKTFVSTDSAWHWYTIEWRVDNDDFTKNFVSIYFDDPFDPTCTAKHNNVNLPSKPQGQPLATTKRFVPTRAGRLNVGPWFGWWGFKDKTNPTPYNTMGVGIAHISIAPQDAGNAGFAFAQTFDQSYVDTNGNLVVFTPDFVDFYQYGGTPAMSDKFFPSDPTPSSGQPSSTCTPKPPPTPSSKPSYFCDTNNTCQPSPSGSTGPFPTSSCGSGCQQPTKFVCSNNTCVASTATSATTLQDCQKSCSSGLPTATIIGIVVGVLLFVILVVLLVYFLVKKKRALKYQK